MNSSISIQNIRLAETRLAATIGSWNEFSGATTGKDTARLWVYLDSKSGTGMSLAGSDENLLVERVHRHKQGTEDGNECFRTQLQPFRNRHRAQPG
jgi:hypothetical protein